MAYYEALWLSAYSPLVCNSKVKKNIPKHTRNLVTSMV